MGKHLDLDDVAADHPIALAELRQLREALRLAHQAFDETERSRRMDRKFFAGKISAQDADDAERLAIEATEAARKAAKGLL